MANRIFYTNLIKSLAGTLSANSAATSYPASKLQTDNYADTYRSTGDSSEWIKVDLGSAQGITAVALGNVNLTTGSTVHVQANATDAWGAPSLDETITVSALSSERRNLYHKFAATQTYRWWRITVADASNPDGFIEIGEWFLGTDVTLDEAISADNQRTRMRNNRELRTEYGVAYVYTRNWNWQFNLSFQNSTQTLRDQIRALDLAVEGNGLPFFFVWDDTSPADSYFVRMANSNLTERQTHNQIHTVEMQMIEEPAGITLPRT